jgi:hypothetical protein
MIYLLLFHLGDLRSESRPSLVFHRLKVQATDFGVDLELVRGADSFLAFAPSWVA